MQPRAERARAQPVARMRIAMTGMRTISFMVYMYMYICTYVYARAYVYYIRMRIRVHLINITKNVYVV